MWELFDEYRQWAKDNPIKEQDFVGKDAKEVMRKRERALNMDAFENFLADKGVITDASDYFENKLDAYKDYISVCARIKRVIRADQIEGGMAGIYNPNITQRLNGLTEKIQEDGTKQLIIKVIDGDTASTDHTG